MIKFNYFLCVSRHIFPIVVVLGLVVLIFAFFFVFCGSSFEFKRIMYQKCDSLGVAIVWNVCYNQDTLEGDGKMRGVIYARYSSDNQREESIEGQIRENTAYAERNGITIVGHYIDRAYSAKTDNRPEFQRMIKDSARRGFDVIIVWKLDRFARNRYDSARYKMLLTQSLIMTKKQGKFLAFLWLTI